MKNKFYKAALMSLSVLVGLPVLAGPAKVLTAASGVRLSINGSQPILLQTNGTGEFGKTIAYFASAQPQNGLLRLRVAQPVLCADFGSGTSGVPLQIIDPNGDTQVTGNANNTFYGLGALVRAELPSSDTGGVRFVKDPSTTNGERLLRVSTKPSLQCFSTASGQFVKAAGAFEPATNAAAPKALDVILANGFEDNSDLEVTVTGVSTIAAGAALTYSLNVRNLGSVGYSGVQVRDFFPKSAGVAVGQPYLANGTWSCVATGGGICGSVSAAGAIYDPGATIPAGALLTYTAVRTVGNSPLPADGTQMTILGAAFSRPSDNEPNLTNNNQAKTVTISSNQPPTFANVPAPVFPQGQCLNTSSTFCETDIFNVSDDQTALGLINVTATSLDTTKITNVAASNFGGADRSVRFKTVPGTAGVTIIRLTATDGNGGTTVVNMSVTITAPNSPPIVTFSANCPSTLGATFTPANGTTPATLTFPSTGGPYPDIYSCDPLATVAPGPSYENGQTMTMNVTGGNTAIVAAQPNTALKLIAGSMKFNGTITGTAGTALYTMTIQDNGGTLSGGNDTTVLQFRVVVQ
jgi:uncharacterized repeat protein (TIGR01451 family)